jgi:hypothetical protein
MAARKLRSSPDTARLKVLASGDERAFAELAIELLRSPQRLQREAALEALAEHPVPSARQILRALFLELDANGPKLDQGAKQRVNIVRYLLASPDSRDVDIAIRATGAREVIMGDDTTYELRSRGMRLLAATAPHLLPYYALERLDDADVPGVAHRDDGEPAATAIQLLAATGNFAVLYQWLRGHGQTSCNLIRAFEAMQDAPPEILQRSIEETAANAIAREDERLCIALAETIVNLEMESSYPHIAAMMSARVSDDLYHYLAVLLASTNRGPLLDILRQQLRRGRRPKLVVEAMRIRTTPEQEEILRKWEDGELDEEP